jgi:electron transfer flavoprotein beta subunit
MRILVCVKRVVDTEMRVKVQADGRRLDVTGVQHILAPYDEIALEKALQLKEAAGQGDVTVLTVGPAEATKELRTALAMGADAALHVVAEPPADPWAAARTLAAAVKGRSFDLILLGASRPPTRTTPRWARCWRRCSTCPAWPGCTPSSATARG